MQRSKIMGCHKFFLNELICMHNGITHKEISRIYIVYFVIVPAPKSHPRAPYDLFSGSHATLKGSGSLWTRLAQVPRSYTTTFSPKLL